MRWLIRIAAPILTVLSFAAAQDGGWRLDKAHSSISFSISHMVISEVHGRFNDYEITFASSKEDFTDASVAASIQVKSIDTGSEGRDRDLNSAKFFDAEKFPEIQFLSSSFKQVGENRYDIAGNLTIRDVTQLVTFHAVYRGMVKTQRGSVSAWKATLEINRFDYGLKWNMMLDTGGLVAGEKVSITMDLEFRK